VRRRARSHSNAERWVLSYADFVTLMFAFFVAMYAISQQDKSGAKRVSESVREAVKTGGVMTTVRSSMATHDGSRTSVGLASNSLASPVTVDPSLLESYRQLSKALKHQIDSGKVSLSLGSRGMVVTLQEQSFFPSGDDSIYSSSFPTIAIIADVIANLPNPVQLDGHTDSVPIHTERFKNNWELSTARSIALLQLLESNYGLEPGRFSVAGHAQNSPVASNTSEEGRARNRRVEIVILPLPINH
jgi:chemotaxis protein MotB